MSTNNSAFSIFRGINYAANANSNRTELQVAKLSSANSHGTESTIVNVADSAAEKQGGKTAITVMLEDFVEKFEEFHGYNHSNITAKDADERGPFRKNTDNIFATKTGQERLKRAENYFQSNIYKDAISEYGGVKYGNKEDLANSALNYAKADINAVEESCALANCDVNGWAFFDGTSDDVLNGMEIGTYIDSNEYDMKYVDLDGDLDKITAEEYASFMIAADKNLDGLISQEEAEIVKNMDNYELKEQAEEVYNKYYSNNNSEEKHKFLFWEW